MTNGCSGIKKFRKSHNRLLEPHNRETGKKLGIATALMFTLPFLAYFVSRYVLFAHKAQPDNWAGGAAILVTNIIVGVYCYSALTEEDDDQDNDRYDSGDNDRLGPRTGSNKRRVD